MKTIEEFWEKVKKTEGCWLWEAYCDKDGYGQLKLVGKSVKAHRVAYEGLIGEIPEGLELDHLCKVRNCVNPAHLEPVTHLENMRRGNTNWAKYITHCPQGHEYTIENTYMPKRNRQCRECRRIKNRKAYHLQRG